MAVNHFAEKQLMIQNVNFERLVLNSIKELRAIDVARKPVTDTGMSLLQICIEYDQCRKVKDPSLYYKWPLKELMRLLLLNYDCDPNIMTFKQDYTLLTFCSKYQKYQSFQMLVELGKDKIDINKQNQDQTTCYGHCFQHAPHLLTLLNKHFKTKINYHLSQIRRDNKLYTPIAFYIKTQNPSDTKEMFTNEYWQKRFPQQYFELNSINEVDQLLYLQQNNSKFKNITEQILQNHIRKESLKQYYLIKKNKSIENPFLLNQGDLDGNELDYLQEQVGFKSNEINEKTNMCLIEVVLSLLIEISSFLDFYSDLKIIYALGCSNDTAWFSFSLFTVLSPYYTIYCSLINYQIQMIRAKDKGRVQSFASKIMILITTLPTLIIFLILIDIIYMALSVVVYPLLLPFAFFNVGSRLLDNYEQAQNHVLNKLFGLSQMEIQGFRSQRTILQFQLESIPQIIFQIYLLIRLKQLKRDGTKFGVSERDILFSVICAIIHVVFEMLSLKVQAGTSETPIHQYVITCYNSRANWIPRQIHFQTTVSIEDNTRIPIEIDREGFYCNGRLGYKIGFKFTDETFQQLCKLISNMSFQKLNLRKTLIIDECFKDIYFDKIIDLGIISSQKVDLMYTAKSFEKFKKQMLKDHSFLDEMQNPDAQDTKTDSQKIMKIAYSNQWSIIELLKEFNADFSIYDKNTKLSFIRIALEQQQYGILTDLHNERKSSNLSDRFQIEYPVFNEQLHIPSNQKLKKSYFCMMASVLFVPDFKLTFFRDFFLYFRWIIISDAQNANYQLAKLRYVVWWSAYGLQTDLSQFCDELWTNDPFKKEELLRHQKFKENSLSWALEFPSKIKVIGNGQMVELSPQFLSQFSLFRKQFFIAYVKNFDCKDYPSQIEIKNVCEDGASIKPQDLKLIEDILNNQQQSPIDLRQLEHLDQIVKVLGYDKETSIYYMNSRLCLHDEDQCKAVQIYRVSVRTLDYTVPDNIAAVKQFTVRKEDTNVLVKYCEYKIKSQANRLEQKTFQGFHNPASEDDASLIFEVVNNKHVPHILPDKVTTQYSIFVAEIKTDMRAGYQFQDLKFLDEQQKEIECSYELKFYKKVKNGQFMEETTSQSNQ